ncbi:nucleoside hydrolase [Nocardia brasiliensis]|uniref:nucleoside hydrolase n=1 Tax=Nocardia brasiliensis TaxID=37326 RepID=UPI002455DCEC|nr:nucleoside hydrolase [Nocardia brasiliensis]
MNTALTDREIVVDSDLGHDPDDLVAIALAAQVIPNLTLLTSDETGGRRAALGREYLAELGRSDVEVIEGIDLGGAERFVTATPAASPRTDQQKDDVVDTMVAQVARICERASSPIVWVGMGPMTNLAAVLTRLPHLAERFDVVQMGGWVAGHQVGPYTYRDKSRASHNLRIDPPAAGVALRMLPEPRLVLSEVTNAPEIRLTPDWPIIRTFQQPSAPAWAQRLSQHLQAWFDRKPGTWMHDPLTLAAALDLGFVHFCHEQVRIASDARLYPDEHGCPVRMSHTADYPAFLEWMHEHLLAAATRTHIPSNLPHHRAQSAAE